MTLLRLARTWELGFLSESPTVARQQRRQDPRQQQEQRNPRWNPNSCGLSGFLCLISVCLLVKGTAWPLLVFSVPPKRARPSLVSLFSTAQVGSLLLQWTQNEPKPQCESKSHDAETPDMSRTGRPASPCIEMKKNANLIQLRLNCNSIL